MFRHILTILSLVTFLGCSKDVYHESSPITPANNSPTNTTPQATSEGASSGGGGYITTNSKKLLELVVNSLATEIRQASPFLFNDLPKEWSQKKLSETILHIRMSSTKDVQRDNSDLLFNYGSDETGPYIEALRPFFFIYGQIPMSFSTPESDSYLKRVVYDLRLKVLHEVAHLLGKDEQQAEEFGLNILRKIEKDFYICMVPREQITIEPNVLWVSPVGKTWWTPNLGGGTSKCSDHQPGCEEIYVFNWIKSNNWIYHQAKNQMIQSSYAITYYSYLDPQPFENLKNVWQNSKEQPGVIWDQKFGRTKPDEIGPQEMSPHIIDGNQTIEYHEQKREMGKNNPSEIKLVLNFEIDHLGNKIFKNGQASVPLMKINFEPPDKNITTMYKNPLAPSGEFTGAKKDFKLKCDYFGENP